MCLFELPVPVIRPLPCCAVQGERAHTMAQGESGSARDGSYWHHAISLRDPPRETLIGGGSNPLLHQQDSPWQSVLSSPASFRKHVPEELSIKPQGKRRMSDRKRTRSQQQFGSRHSHVINTERGASQSTDASGLTGTQRRLGYELGSRPPPPISRKRESYQRTSISLLTQNKKQDIKVGFSYNLSTESFKYNAYSIRLSFGHPEKPILHQYSLFPFPF